VSTRGLRSFWAGPAPSTLLAPTNDGIEGGGIGRAVVGVEFSSHSEQNTTPMPESKVGVVLTTVWVV